MIHLFNTLTKTNEFPPFECQTKEERRFKWLWKCHSWCCQMAEFDTLKSLPTNECMWFAGSRDTFTSSGNGALRWDGGGEKIFFTCKTEVLRYKMHTITFKERPAYCSWTLLKCYKYNFYFAKHLNGYSSNSLQCRQSLHTQNRSSPTLWRSDCDTYSDTFLYSRFIYFPV